LVDSLRFSWQWIWVLFLGLLRWCWN
jgi:hypothetical protein